MKRRTKVYISIVGGVFALVLVLHVYGYRIYGHPYMYWPKPVDGEGWRQVAAFHAPSTIELSDGRQIDFSPFELTEKGKGLTTDQLVYAIFQTPPEAFYLKEMKDGIWMARIHDRFACSLPSWFPGRVLGVYEEELREWLYHGDISADPKERVVDFPNEEVALSYLNKIRQDRRDSKLRTER